MTDNPQWAPPQPVQPAPQAPRELKLIAAIVVIVFALAVIGAVWLYVAHRNAVIEHNGYCQADKLINDMQDYFLNGCTN